MMEKLSLIVILFLLLLLSFLLATFMQSHNTSETNEISTSSKDMIKPESRQKRDFTGNHGYAGLVYDHLWDKFGRPGVWKKLKCNTTFNCETVSTNHCTKRGGDFFCSTNTVNEDCVFNFSLIINLKHYSYSEGGDLAIYKAMEPNSSSVYQVYIFFMESTIGGHLTSSRTISSECNGWQVFHLSEIVTESLQDGLNNLGFRILVTRDQYSVMTCEEIGNVFLINTSYIKNDPPLYISGDHALFFDFDKTIAAPQPDQMDTNSSDDNPFLIPEDKLIDYIPVLHLFYATKRKKRNASTSVSRKDMTRKREVLCVRMDKEVILTTMKVKGEEYKIIKPEIYNIGECRTVSKETDVNFECVAIKYTPLEVLAVKETNDQVFSIQSQKNLVIEECGPKFFS